MRVVGHFSNVVTGNSLQDVLRKSHDEHEGCTGCADAGTPGWVWLPLPDRNLNPFESMTVPDTVAGGSFDDGLRPYARTRAGKRRKAVASNFGVRNLVTYPALYEEITRTATSDPAPAAFDDGKATRILNVMVAVVGLIITAPLFILIAIAIKITTRGPVFYSQTRVGLDRRTGPNSAFHEARRHDLGGRPFTMYKFRTMYVNAEPGGHAVWAAKNDPRITVIGHWLRAFRLDELPQLFNVLAGDMNVVGPRPERPSIFAELRDAIPDYHLRQRVMPGITGWAQVNLAYDTCVDDVRRKVDLDLEYVRARSLSRDLSIMAKTIPVMVSADLGW